MRGCNVGDAQHGAYLVLSITTLMDNRWATSGVASSSRSEQHLCSTSLKASKLQRTRGTKHIALHESRSVARTSVRSRKEATPTPQGAPCEYIDAACTGYSLRLRTVGTLQKMSDSQP